MTTQHQNGKTATPKKHTAKAHRAILLEELKTHPVDTFQARDELDIPSPAPRIFELRHIDGYNIVTQWVTKQGHRIAQYVLNKTFVQADLFEGVSHE